MIQYSRVLMTDEMLQTELLENRERRSLFLCVPFESSHLHHKFWSIFSVLTHIIAMTKYRENPFAAAIGIML